MRDHVGLGDSEAETEVGRSCAEAADRRCGDEDGGADDGQRETRDEQDPRHADGGRD